MARSKIGFHTGPGGIKDGLGNWERALNGAGQAFGLKASDECGPLFEAFKRADENSHQQPQQNRADLQARPLGSIEHSMVVLILLVVFQARYSQGSSRGSFAWAQDSPNQQDLNPIPDPGAKNLHKWCQYDHNLWWQDKHLISSLAG
jgi:hypothetical protein